MESSAEGIWGIAQNHLRCRLSSNTYNLWFAPLRARSFDQNSLVVEVANEFCGIWLKDNYADLLQNAVATACGRSLEIRLEVAANGASCEAPAPKPSHAKPRCSQPASRASESCQNLGA